MTAVGAGHLTNSEERGGVMSVGGVETPVVYFPPQAITPLSASKEPIVLALAARPRLDEPSGATALKAAADQAVKAVGGVDKTSAGALEKQGRSLLSSQSETAGAAAAAHVDVYV
jgi:hypothetical protein